MSSVNFAPDYKSLFPQTNVPKTDLSEDVSFDATTLIGGYNALNVARELDRYYDYGLDRTATSVVGSNMSVWADKDERLWGKEGNVLFSIGAGQLDSVLMCNVADAKGTNIGRGVRLADPTLSMSVVEVDGKLVFVKEDPRGDRTTAGVDELDLPALQALNVSLNKSGYGREGAFRLLAEGLKLSQVGGGVAERLRETKTLDIMVKTALEVETTMTRCSAIEAVKKMVAYRPPANAPEGVIGQLGSRYDTVANNPGEVILALWLLDNNPKAFVESGGMDFAYILVEKVGECIDALMENKEEGDGFISEAIKNGDMYKYFLGGGDSAMAKLGDLKAKIDAMNPLKNIAF